MAKRKRNVLTGVEIGTATVKVVMGEFQADDILSIIGVGETPSLKVVKGEVAEPPVVLEQLERALALAEQASDVEIGDVFLAVTGAHIRTVNSVGVTLVAGADRTIGEGDVINAARNAHFHTLPPDRKPLHYFDRFYTIDGTLEVTSPLNHVGTKLAADVHIIYGQHNRIETACRLLADAIGYPATDVAFSGVAAGLAAFSPEEARMGGLLIDIGAGVTEYVVFQGPGCYHSGQVTVGCEHAINDLAIGLGLPFARCRRVLHELGRLGGGLLMPADGRARLLEVEALGRAPRHIPLSTVEQVIELRFRELFEIILADLRAQGAFERIGSGVWLAGGGALIPGIDRLARHVFQMPVATARPRLLSGKSEIVNSPLYLTPVGLLRWGKMTLDIGQQPLEPVRTVVLRDIKRFLELMRRSFHW